jgi:hypothetical protein
LLVARGDSLAKLFLIVIGIIIGVSLIPVIAPLVVPVLAIVGALVIITKLLKIGGNKS